MSRERMFDAGYGDCYDLFYATKDYAAECDFLEAVFGRFSIEKPQSILDLGCGTGNHAMVLATRGYTVHGVDRSATMLERARCKAAQAKLPGLSFDLADIRDLELGRQFDAAIMMFAVLGYQTSNTDLATTLAAVHRHLRPGGIFVADFWYGPTVLRERPGERIHEYMDGNLQILRLAVPELLTEEQAVRVTYRVLKIGNDRLVAESQEVHAMRFFFPMELAYFAERAGLSLLHLGPFMELGALIHEQTWNAVGVFRSARHGNISEAS